MLLSLVAAPPCRIKAPDQLFETLDSRIPPGILQNRNTAVCRKGNRPGPGNTHIDGRAYGCFYVTYSESGLGIGHIENHMACLGKDFQLPEDIQPRAQAPD